MNIYEDNNNSICENVLENDCIMENFINKNKNLLLPYEEDEIRTKLCTIDIKCFGNMSNEKKENFEKHKNYKYVQYGKYYLFTENITNRYKFFPEDHINFIYKIASKDNMMLGKGAFGEVIKCYSRKFHSYCAVKIIKNDIKYENASRTEITNLLKLNKESTNPHVVQLIENFKYRGHMFLVFDCYYKNMYELIKAGKYKGFPIFQCIEYAYQLADGLNFIHSKNIVHADLKPENILYKTYNLDEIIIIDFGLSTDETKLNDHLNEYKKTNKYTSRYFYVQSRYYRAIETALCISRDRNIDIWSYGAILYEMLFGSPIFNSKDNYKLIEKIIEVTGYPSYDIINKYSLQLALPNSCSLINSENTDTFLVEQQSHKKLKYINPVVVDNYFNVIKCCFVWDFEKRVKANNLLELLKLVKYNIKDVHTFDIDTQSIINILTN